jgi:predicted acylesterase/phospholipase RssA
MRRIGNELGGCKQVAGLLFPYHLGVVEELCTQGWIKNGTALAGSSGGALAAVFCGLQLNADAALEATFNICNAINMSPRKSSRGILGSLLAKELDSFLPQDAHIRLNQWQGSVRIGLVSPSSASLGLCETCMLGVIRQFSLPVF